MPDVIKRLKYYNGQFLQEPDFTAEQDYHLDRQRRHNRLFHTPGIADGLAVTATAGTTSASVAPGTAIDGQGRQIVLHEPRTVGFPSSLNGQPALVVISYTEEESDDATVGDAGKTRWKEVPRVEAILDDGTPPGDRIPLARLQIAANGTIAQQDLTVRAPAGARLRPEETFERLRLSRQGVGSSQWPVLTSGAPGRADLTGDLNVTGNVLVAGTVDGRDVAADGALNETHRGRTDNPHGVTAAQLADYDFKRIYTNSIWFLESYGDGATRTFDDVGFQPRFVWVYGFANAYMYNGWYGNSTHGFARIDGGTITQRASGPSVIRQSGSPGLVPSGIQHSNGVCVGSFYDYLSSPSVTATVSARVSATTADSITFLLTRPATVPTFDLWFHFICLGY